MICFGVLIVSIYRLGKISDPNELDSHKLKFSIFFEEFKSGKPDETFYYLLFVLRRYTLCIMIYFVESYVLQMMISFCFTLAVSII